MRRSLFVLLFSLSVLLLAGIGGVAQALDPNDDFDDGVLDLSKWAPYTWPGPSGTIEEHDGALVMTMGGTGSDYHDDLWSQWELRGAFDIQVDYEILQWPQNGYVAIALMANPLGDLSSVQRVQFDTGGNAYLAGYLNLSHCVCGGIDPTADTSGTLSLVRDAESNLTGYYWSAGSSEWIAFGSALAPGDMRVALALFGTVDQPAVVAFDNFQVNSGEPVPISPTIEDVMIDRGRDTDWWDWARYHQRVTIRVKGSEWEQPACLLIEDMQGSRYVIPTCGAGSWYDPLGSNPGGSSDVRITEGPDYAYTYTWYEARKPLPIPEGSYRISVVGNAGSLPTLTTPVAPAVPEDGPALSGPAPDSVIDTAVPAFEWLSLPGWENWLQVRAEGATNYTGPLPEEDDCGQIWRAGVTGLTSALYSFDGMGPDLEPGRTYFWQVNAWTPVDDRMTDPRVSVWTEQTARHRFTIDTEWPPLPMLPGKLAYTQRMYGGSGYDFDLEAIEQYGISVHTRKWIGPDASESPDFSWDGSKLQYRICDTGTWIDNLDGSPPTPVPNQESWADSSLSPDASSIVYGKGSPINGMLEIWVQKIDGSDKRLLVPLRARQERRAKWSPDGAWIAYSSCCDPSGYNVWLIRPDGTQDHPVIATTLEGYPRWTVTWLGAGPKWSPDARRLGASFSADSPDGSTTINGLGTISRDGGPITPVWIDPPTALCCAASLFSTWSPDGRSVLFTSGFHLPFDPEWESGKLEPGVEMWLINADGTGEPTRLTYDYSYVEGATWWAPNTPASKGVSVVKGDATVTFAHVKVAGSTRMNVTGDVPGPAPKGYAFVGDLWDGATTAETQGSITIALHYDASLVGQENLLAVMQWEDAKAKWQDKTARPIDKVNRIIRATTSNLGMFALVMKTT